MNVCIYLHVCLYIYMKIYIFQISKFQIFIILILKFQKFKMKISENNYEKAKNIKNKIENLKKLPEKNTQIIPILCVIDIFSSTHYVSFKGYYKILEKNDLYINTVTDDDDKCECSAFSSVMSIDIGEKYENDGVGGEKSDPNFQKKNNLSKFNFSDKNINFEKRMSSSSSSSSTYDGTYEGSFPTFIDLLSNVMINGNNILKYVSTDVRDVSTDLSTVRAELLDLSWRKAHVSNIYSHEVFLTVDMDNNIKVWLC
jgi:hypothetical protein